MISSTDWINILRESDVFVDALYFNGLTHSQMAFIGDRSPSEVLSNKYKLTLIINTCITILVQLEHLYSTHTVYTHTFISLR
jgi:hypothetical protein